MRRASSIRGWRAPEPLRFVVSVPPLFAAFCVSVLRCLLFCGFSIGSSQYTGVWNSVSKRAPMLVSLSVSSHRAMSLAMVPGESDA